MMICAGIDPGSSTGIVILETGPRVADPLYGARLLASATVHGLGPTKTRTEAEGRALLFVSVRAILIQHCPRVIAIENPSDGMAKWSGDGRPTRRETASSLGESYGLCCAAAYDVTYPRPGAHLYSYAVTDAGRSPAKRQKRPGWMPLVRRGKSGNFTASMPREELLSELRHQLAQLGRRADVDPMSATEHELMAFGVLRFHLAHTGRLPDA